MCNRAGGLIARVVEASGIPTVCLSINLQMSQQLRAPRTVFVKFPHGSSFGAPQERDQQMTILRDLFWALQQVEEPGTIVEPGYRWRRSTYSAVEFDSFQL